MRPLTERDRLLRFMHALGDATRAEVRVYFTGGATAVLLGWRSSTIDVDLVFEPERDDVYRAIASLKDTLPINVELASPAHFLPALPGWAERSIFIAREGHASFFHYDLYSQALAKIERAHAQDDTDVRAMLDRGLVERRRLGELYSQIEPQLYRFPAVNAGTLKARVAAIAGS
jgi:hypothetical protein